MSSPSSSVMALCIVGCILFAMILLFQIALAIGAWPFLHEYSYGGYYKDQQLPTRFRVASLISAIIWSGAFLLMLVRASAISGDETVARSFCWFYFALLVLGTLANAASQSRKEKVVWTPICATAAAICCTLAVI